MKKLPWHYLPIALLLSILSGVLLAFALPPRGPSVLGWIALLPLLIAARIERPIVGFLCGMITALVCGGICGGKWDEAWQYGNLVAAFGSLAIVFGLVTSLASSCHTRLNPGLWPFFVACMGVTGELLGSNLFPVSIAISQYQNLIALHLASVTGTWGVTFLLWLVPAGLVAACPRFRPAVPALSAALVVLLAAWLMPVVVAGKPLTVAAVQATDGYQASEQTSTLAGRARIVVWPETLLGVYSILPATAAKSAQLYVLANISEPNPSGKPYNAAYLFSPAGQRVGSSRKHHLFGKERFGFASGTPSAPARVMDFRVGMPICFDTLFTDVSRDLVRRGADILLVPNHDPEMPNSMFNYLHSAIIPFRAAENGVPIVWSECLGLSTIVDSDGRILARAPAQQCAAVLATIHPRSGTTFFTRAGDYFAYLCCVFAAAAFMLSYRRRARI